MLSQNKVGLSILSLNIMHGRNADNSVFPIRTPKQTVLGNLDRIADTVRNLDPDVVCLQEVDTNSLTNGDTDECAYIARKTALIHSFTGRHYAIGPKSRPLWCFGTSILSKFPLSDAQSFVFPFSFPTPRKGFVVARVQKDRIEYTVASVHFTWLNWLRKNSHRNEARILFEKIHAREKLIFAGDFNIDLHRLEEFKDMNIISGSEPTHPSSAPKDAIDWIAISSDLSFAEYRVLNTRLSDHMPVFAKISL